MSVSDNQSFCVSCFFFLFCLLARNPKGNWLFVLEHCHIFFSSEKDTDVDKLHHSNESISAAKSRHATIFWFLCFYIFNIPLVISGFPGENDPSGHVPPKFPSDFLRWFDCDKRTHTQRGCVSLTLYFWAIITKAKRCPCREFMMKESTPHQRVYHKGNWGEG